MTQFLGKFGILRPPKSDFWIKNSHFIKKKGLKWQKNTIFDYKIVKNGHFIKKKGLKWQKTQFLTIK